MKNGEEEFFPSDKRFFTLPRQYLSPKLLRSILLPRINRRAYEESRVI